ncbi:MAG: hypothetical protein GC206_17140, partial [Alphaproteobacteria bacterium]|nr:hypothetical protein [Alphaproteobacteria bacterium]
MNEFGVVRDQHVILEQVTGGVGAGHGLDAVVAVQSRGEAQRRVCPVRHRGNPDEIDALPVGSAALALGFEFKPTHLFPVFGHVYRRPERYAVRLIVEVQNQRHQLPGRIDVRAEIISRPVYQQVERLPDCNSAIDADPLGDGTCEPA